VYGGEVMRNHNHLLGAVKGVDGIKTGYTRTSGFNLITSVHRDGRHIIAVILGGRTASERDAHMRKLITTYIKPAIFQGVALVQHQSLAVDERTNNSSDPTQAFIVKAVAPEAQQQVPTSPLTLGATPIKSPNFLKPGGEVSARWPSPSEMFEPLAIPGIRSGTNDDARNSERRKPDSRD
jgi:D-alanyl-D-alanine carboxypeptidase